MHQYIRNGTSSTNQRILADLFFLQWNCVKPPVYCDDYLSNMVIFHIYFSAKDCFHPFSVSEEQNMAWSPVNVPGRTNKMQGDTWFPKSSGLTLHVYHNCKKPKHTVPIFRQFHIHSSGTKSRCLRRLNVYFGLCKFGWMNFRGWCFWIRSRTKRYHVAAVYTILSPYHAAPSKL